MNIIKLWFCFLGFAYVFCWVIIGGILCAAIIKHKLQKFERA